MDILKFKLEDNFISCQEGNNSYEIPYNGYFIEEEKGIVTFYFQYGTISKTWKTIYHSEGGSMMPCSASKKDVIESCVKEALYYHKYPYATISDYFEYLSEVNHE